MCSETRWKGRDFKITIEKHNGKWSKATIRAGNMQHALQIASSRFNLDKCKHFHIKDTLHVQD